MQTMVRDAMALNLDVVQKQVTQLDGVTNVRLTLRDKPIDDDDTVLDSCAMGLLYTICALSFSEAKPFASSEIEFVEDDGFTVEDLVERVRYEKGRLTVHCDYVRGRRMKTDIIINPDGNIELTTNGRGEAALQWVATLQGKRTAGPAVDDLPSNKDSVN